MWKKPRPDSYQVVDHLQNGNLHYEQRFNLCGKANCSKCNTPPADSEDPRGHGPYWYLIARTKGQTRRLYIGKHLDTQKYVTPDGRVDWAAVKAKR